MGVHSTDISHHKSYFDTTKSLKPLIRSDRLELVQYWDTRLVDFITSHTYEKKFFTHITSVRKLIQNHKKNSPFLPPTQRQSHGP